MTAPDSSARAHWLSVLANAAFPELEMQWRKRVPLAPSYVWLKKPEHGAVLVRGRAGREGGQFNLGEMTVTRCSLQLADGRIGIAYVPGRNKRHAAIAAQVDALLQGSDNLAGAARIIVDVLSDSFARNRAEIAARTRETAVDFTMVVGG